MITSTPNETLEQQLQRVRQERNVLYEVSRAMRTTLELEHILYIILTGVTSHSGLGYNRAILYLVNPKARRLECKMAIGPESGEHATKIWDYIERSQQKLDDLIQVDKIATQKSASRLYNNLEKLFIPLDSEEVPPHILMQAYRRGVPWHLSSADIAAHPDDPFLKVFRTNDTIIVPLKAKNIITGLIVADNIYTPRPISDEDLRIFTMLADQAALAIENSQLYEMVVQRSHTDPVTNVWNHGFFQEKLSAEIDRLKALGEPVSLAMIDIDDFKKLNDTHGHQYGDMILREMADVIRDSSRDSDYVCRYGGEEFAIILLQTSREKNQDICERMRERIADHPFTAPPGSPDPKHVTVSIGAATLPNDAVSKENLIAQADRAMYIAKFSGKNRTCLARQEASEQHPESPPQP